MIKDILLTKEDTPTQVIEVLDGKVTNYNMFDVYMHSCRKCDLSFTRFSNCVLIYPRSCIRTIFDVKYSFHFEKA